jgi:hypothetical protein
MDVFWNDPMYRQTWMMTNFVWQMHFLPIWDTWFSKFSGGAWPQIPLVVPFLHL